MNRILSVILSIIFVLSMPQISVFARDSVSVVIDNPADGDVVENTGFEVELTTEGEVSQTILEFDGSRISGTALTEDMLTVGEHILTAYVIGEDGSVGSATSMFTVVKNIRNINLDCDFSQVDTSASNFSASTVQLGDGITSIPQVSKAWKGIVSVVEGPDGEGDNAINLTSSSSFSSSRPFFRFLVQNGNIATTAVAEFDINVNSGTNILLSYADTTNATGYLATNTGYLFDKSGKILGTSESYTTNKWYHIKLTIDVANAVADLSVSYYDEDAGADVTVDILDDADIDRVANISDIRLNYHGNAGCGFGIDNVSILEEAEFTGIGNISFICENDELFDEAPVVSELTSIKLYMNEAVTAKDFESNVQLLGADGSEVSLESVQYIADDNALLLTPAETLDVNAQYKAVVHLCTVYAGELSSEDKASISFKTASDSYAYTWVDFRVDSTRLITSSQMKNKNLTANVYFSNSETEEHNISVVLAVRSNGKLVGLDIADAVISADATDQIVTLKTDVIPEDIGDVTIQIMMLESMTNRVTVFPTYEVKF